MMTMMMTVMMMMTMMMMVIIMMMMIMMMVIIIIYLHQVASAQLVQLQCKGEMKKIFKIDIVVNFC